MTGLLVTKQQFTDTLFARYKRLYNKCPSEKVITDAKAGAEMQFDVLWTEGFILVDKQALQKKLEEAIQSLKKYLELNEGREHPNRTFLRTEGILKQISGELLGEKS